MHNVFTFGFDHKHPATGESLSNCYVIVEGNTDEECRDKMIKAFGLDWAFQYPESSGWKPKSNYRRIPFPTEEAVNA